MAEPTDSGHVIAEVAATIDRVAPYLAAPQGPALNALRNSLREPPRLALVGRASAGKSTLLNALVGQRVAPTNVTEGTQVITWYRFGEPARVKVIGLDNSTETIMVENRLPDQFGLSAAEIHYVIAHIPLGPLREYELIDTPGLAAIPGLQRPDARLFLCDGAPRADEVALLNDVGATWVDTLAVLSRADAFGEGAFGSVDPLEMAAEHAERLKSQLAHLAGSVLPVSALLAQTALTGHLTEDDARALQQMGTVEKFELLAGLLAGQDGAGRIEAHVERLLERVGEYGLVHARGPAERGALALERWLEGKSGINAVREHIMRRFVYRNDVRKAGQILKDLKELGASSPHRPQIDSILEKARMQAGLHPLQELAALEKLLQWDSTHSLVHQLDHLLMSATPAQRLRLPAEADPATIDNAAQQECVRCRHERLTAFSGAERVAWTVLERSYQLLFTRN